MDESRQLAVIVAKGQSEVLPPLDRVLLDMPGTPEVYEVTNSADALDVLDHRMVALVILPSAFAEGDGLGLAAAIKAISPATSVIMTVAGSTSQIERQAQAAGVDRVLSEPYTAAQLEQVLRAALGVQVRAVGLPSWQSYRNTECHEPEWYQAA